MWVSGTVAFPVIGVTGGTMKVLVGGKISTPWQPDSELHEVEWTPAKKFRCEH